MSTRTKLTALFVTICTLLAVGCEKEPIAQIDPNTYEATNVLMGCKWVSRTVNMFDDKARDTSYLKETIIFTSDSTAKYYYEYRGTHASDDNQYTASITYIVTSQGTYGFSGEMRQIRDDRPEEGYFRSTYQYEKNADVFLWNQNGFYKVFTRE